MLLNNPESICFLPLPQLRPALAYKGRWSGFFGFSPTPLSDSLVFIFRAGKTGWWWLSVAAISTGIAVGDPVILIIILMASYW